MNGTTFRGLVPASVSLGDQIHVFANDYGYLTHTYWDGNQWLPKGEWEILGQGLDDSTNIAATVRGSDRIHIVG